MILFFHRKRLVGPGSMKFRHEHGFTASDDTTWQSASRPPQLSFRAKRFTALERVAPPEVHDLLQRDHQRLYRQRSGLPRAACCKPSRKLSPCPAARGYFHFPRMARVGNWGTPPWFGMTGRFQKAW